VRILLWFGWRGKGCLEDEDGRETDEYENEYGYEYDSLNRGGRL